MSCSWWILPPGKILCLRRVAHAGRRRLQGLCRNVGGRSLVRVGNGRFLRQLGDCLGVLLLWVAQVAGEKLLVASLVLRLLVLVLVLVWELVLLLLLLLLLMGPGFKDLLGVLLMLQVSRDLTVRLYVSPVLAVSSVLSGVKRRLCVRSGNRTDSGRLNVLCMLQVQGLVRILNYVRLVEISYTLQGGWLSRRALVLPVELLLLVKRDLGDAGADGWGVRRREAHALGVPAGQAWNSPELAAVLRRR